MWDCFKGTLQFEIDNKIYSPLAISGYIHNRVGAYY